MCRFFAICSLLVCLHPLKWGGLGSFCLWETLPYLEITYNSSPSNTDTSQGKLR